MHDFFENFIHNSLPTSQAVLCLLEERGICDDIFNLDQLFSSMQIKILLLKSSLNELLHLAAKIAVKAFFHTQKVVYEHDKQWGHLFITFFSSQERLSDG